MTMQRQQRGYSLVEIMIVLTVMMMVASALGVNYYNAHKERQYTATEETISQAKDALVRYAARHRTSGMKLIRQNPFGVPPTSLTVIWQVPSGRPYLPCPDVDLDGYEDREDNRNFYATSPGGLVPVLANTFNITESPPRCVAHKGVLPWRSLESTPFLDAWGNHISYRVSPGYASPLIGFDEGMMAGDAAVGPTNYTLTVISTVGVGSTSGLPVGGTVVLNQHTRIPNTTLMISGYISDIVPSIVCLSVAPCNLTTAIPSALAAGEVLILPMTSAVSSALLPAPGIAVGLPVYAEYPNHSVVRGVPVVLVSHGENGAGAWKEGGLGCGGAAALSIASPAEQQNAYRVHCSSAPPITGVVSHAFVYRAPSRAHTDGYDDIVAWLTTEDLATRLTRSGVFPVRKFPPIGLDDY